jgi:hypothetical protein
MVRLHFLFLSSVTPTRNVERGLGTDSPAELLKEPCGTLNAGSARPNFCMDVWGLSPKVRFSGELPKLCNDCFALLKRSLARPTPLLLRFFSPTGLSSTLRAGLRSSSCTESLLSFAAFVFTFGFASLALFVGCLELPVMLLLVSLPFPFELPNILPSNPPCPEILLRGLPARLLELPAAGALIY